MKAEHRKELHTNLLADRMGRLVQGMKSGPKANFTVAWVIGILAVGLFIAWLIATNAANGSHSQLWLKLETDKNPEELQALADNYPGTTAARMAQFQRARILLQEEGLAMLFSDERARAIEDIRTARDLYKKLAQQCTDNSVLTQEAWLGVAKAEEALVGIPHPENTAENREQLSRAFADYVRYLALAIPGAPAFDGSLPPLEYYDRYLASAVAPTPLAQTVKKHAEKLREELKSERPAIVAFYAELNRIADAEAAKSSPKP